MSNGKQQMKIEDNEFPYDEQQITHEWLMTSKFVQSLNNLSHNVYNWTE